MTKLSVNINKFATLRNARGGNIPDVIKAAQDCERFGAEGITVHPRPDERHIRYNDARQLKGILKTEFNIEGNPIKSFVELVLDIIPAQVTLVPDSHDVLTSNCGWDTKKSGLFLKDICSIFRSNGIRTSIFIDPNSEMIKYAADTEAYASGYSIGREAAISPYVKAAETAVEMGLGINAGHDLSLENLRYFSETISYIAEVSIGHALICDALYLGLENTIQSYLRQLNKY